VHIKKSGMYFPHEFIVGNSKLPIAVTAG